MMQVKVWVDLANARGQTVVTEHGDPGGADGNVVTEEAPEAGPSTGPVAAGVQCREESAIPNLLH